jgi:hypothetical protein
VGQYLGITSTGLGWFSAVGGGIICAVGGILVPARGPDRPVDRPGAGQLQHGSPEAGWRPSPQRPSVELPSAGAAPRSTEIPALLRELAALRDAGVLTADEFEAKKAALLERM